MSRVYNPPIGTSTGWDTAQPMGAIRPENDFPDSSQITSLHQKYVQLSTYYTAPTQNATTVYAGITFYLTNDTGFQDIGGGALAWEREWAAIPTERTIWETIDYAMPAFAPSLSIGTTYPATGAVNNTGNNTLALIVSSGTWKKGQLVGLGWTIGTTAYKQYFYTIQSVIGSSIVIYPGNSSFATNSATTISTNTYIANLNTTTARWQPLNLASRSKVVYDYFLPTVSAGVSTPNDITVYQRFKAVDTNNVEIQYLNDYSTPSSATWAAWVAAPTVNMQDAVDSQLNRWKGQIYERKRVLFCPL